MARIPVESFVLGPAQGATLQRQVQDAVTRGVLAGRMRPGDRMPSSRALARHLGLSRITVTLAYADLVANDYLVSRGRSGTFVSPNAPTPAPVPRAARPARGGVDWSRALGQRFPDPAPLARPADWRRYPYPFIYGQTDQRLFDHGNWRRCALQALGSRDFGPLSEDAYARDDPYLVEQITTRILPRRGIDARPEEVLVTMGAQNALWMAAQVLLTQRRTAVMERPCYPALREILQLGRCIAQEVAVDGGGLPPGQVPEGADVLFVTPSHHCPTGVTMPLARRRALLALAERREMLIVEDDYEFELGFVTPPLPALKSLDRTGRVIYIGSFAKSLFPGLRLGYLVAAEPVIRELRALRGLVLRHVPGHVQRTAAYFLAQGHWDAQVARMTRAFRDRRAAAQAAMDTHGLAPARANAFGGSSFWMRAPEGVRAIDLADRLRARGVLIEPADAFFSDPRPGPFYRLAYSSIASEDIPEGIARIARETARLAGSAQAVWP
ncbi:PLP-dependent aminotransferase family protein [Jannaschia aquimarina]|uniref:GabR protein n=1 Tax=Jannaschia aquimarina TaxID=935700 RepID=A0A0D1EGI3_9RHOB|nr:PLP-dependent aminotransferase family protein [Jannaschia aquimarina]KIT16031.1 HTH-type transcriptional regulatory protein GabR [Jannaschia aquimarina]SNT00517.1 transcriptional regulator, GntR family [Jannaschia aquimarina]